MKPYLVTWEIEIDANTPEEAAIEARRIQLDRDSTDTYFDVSDELEQTTKFQVQGKVEV